MFSRHESFGCYLKPNDLIDFDELKLIESIKTETEKEITETGAKILESVKNRASGFYVKYTDEDIKGRIEITGSLQRANHLPLQILI